MGYFTAINFLKISNLQICNISNIYLMWTSSSSDYTNNLKPTKNRNPSSLAYLKEWTNRKNPKFNKTHRIGLQ